MRILVADDNPALLDQVCRLLEPYSDVVGTAGSGAALLAAAERLHPDVLVVDVAMPAMNGFEAIRSYRRGHGSARVVVLSGYCEAAMAEAALRSGADAFVPKIHAAEQLVPAIQS